MLLLLMAPYALLFLRRLDLWIRLLYIVLTEFSLLLLLLMFVGYFGYLLLVFEMGTYLLMGGNLVVILFLGIRRLRK